VLRKLTLRGVALGYLGVILLAPLAMIFYNTFKTGLEPMWHAVSDPNTIHAFQVTLYAAAIAVPVNTVFGVLCGLLIVRRSFPGKGVLNAFIDLPLAVSPVVVGLCLYLLYAKTGWFGGTMFGPYGAHPVLFALPGIVLATIFVSIPFVAREVIPTLRELGTEQEQAAATLGASRWQRFWRITLPSLRWAIIYGVVLTTARCLGEYGAVALVSGRVEGQTETATVRVDNLMNNFDTTGAYSVSLVLALIAVVVFVAMTLFKPREARFR
jgi:sulfate transport system permease protein